MTVIECPRRWTRAEYYRMGEAGVFGDERVELRGGEIWALPPQTPQHFAAAEAAADALQAAFRAGSDVRRRGPLTFGDETEPEPDSDSMLAKDRGKKAEDYARAGIADYWIVNVVNRRLEVHRDLGPLPSGHGYKLRCVLLEGEAIAPLLAPDRPVSVADLLPRQVPPQP